MRAGPQIRGPALMRGGLGILARNNFAGRANSSCIFAGQARSGPIRDGLARFAIPNRGSAPHLPTSTTIICEWI